MHALTYDKPWRVVLLAKTLLRSDTFFCKVLAALDCTKNCIFVITFSSKSSVDSPEMAFRLLGFGISESVVLGGLQQLF